MAAARAHATCPAGRPCVAVLDTGIDPSHPDFSRAEIVFRDFTTPGGAIRDDFGHGTAVASRIAGNGACARGLVPAARLFVGKVNVPGEPDAVDFGAVKRGIDWAVAEGARVVSLSLGGPDIDGGEFALGSEGVLLGKNEVERAISRAAASGVVTVVAVGNTFVLSSEVNTPANAVEALVVGAAATDGTPKALPLLVSPGKVGFDRRRDGSFSDLDPHVTAVGTEENVMARAAGTDMGGAAEPVGSDGAARADGRCVRAAGTSFSTPWVAGLVALLREAYGGTATGGGLVQYLVRLVQWSARDTPFPYSFEGFGFVEDPAVVGAALSRARSGALPAAPEPNESLRIVSDAVRTIY